MANNLTIVIVNSNSQISTVQFGNAHLSLGIFTLDLLPFPGLHQQISFRPP